MRVLIIFLAALSSIVAASAQSAEQTEASQPVQVLVVGTYHFHNPGLDQHNIEADSVLTEKRQSELQDLSASLAAFRPTHVMVEMQSFEEDYSIPSFEQFSKEDLDSDTNEIVQIGFRLARDAYISTVYGIDVQPSEGEETFFPIDRVQKAASASGESSILARLNENIDAWVENFNASQTERSISDLLLEVNRTDFPGGQSYYDTMLPIASGGDLAGAHMNARWYARNVAIFAKLMQIVEPGDRVVVIYGAGHAPWLRHFARTISGYSNVDVVPFLREASKTTQQK